MADLLAAADPAARAAATAFLRIKAWALPASIAVFVCNSTHMAQRRQVRALLLQIVGMIAAVGLDVALIAHLGMGVRGAAVTAVLSQYLILAMQLTSARQLARAGGVRLSVRKASATVARNTLSRLGPLSVMYISKTLAYCTITAAAALTGLVNAAAHQAMWPTFVVCSFLNAPMEAATLTFLPFILNGSISTLTALDFLGFGLPPGSASLGELLAQGKNNLQAPWLGITGFLVISLMLSLLIFIGEAVRDAFDPRKSLG